MRLNRTVLVLALLLLGSGRALAGSLTLDPAAQTAATGSIVSVDLVADSFSANGLGGFDVDIGYDPLALAFDSVVFGTGLNLGNPADSFQVVFDLGGLLDLSELSFVFPFADLRDAQATLFPMTLAAIRFRVIDLPDGATTSVVIDDGTLGDAPVASDAFGVRAPIDSTSNATITGVAAQVPESGTVALLGLGLAAFALSRRRRGARLRQRSSR